MNKFKIASPYLGALCVLLVGICYFYFFACYHFWAQESMQAFIPSQHALCYKPGGCLQFISMYLTQEFVSLPVAVAVPGILLMGVYSCTFRILQTIHSDAINYVLATALSVFLMQAYTNYNIFIDGLLGILLVGLFVIIGLSITKKIGSKAIYSLLAVLFLYFVAQQACIVFALIWLALHLQKGRNAILFSLCPVLLSLILSYYGLSKGEYFSLYEGIYSLGYQRSQFHPYAFIYYIWIRYVGGLFIAGILSYLMGFVYRLSWIIRCASCLTPVYMLIMGLPNADAIRQHQVQQLAYWNRTNQPQLIEKFFQENPITDYVQLNYLNLALAKQGVLADRLFQYRQHGQQGLLTEWDRTALLSDVLGLVHFTIGDYTMSESYATEQLSLSNRGGSGPALQRLAECALLRADRPIATKYLHILQGMPHYHDWANQQLSRLDNGLTPQGVYAQSDALSSQLTVDSLWSRHSFDNEIAQQYRGCSYLLGGQLDLFQSFVIEYQQHHAGELLPVFFQQAVMLLATNNRDLLEQVNVSDGVHAQFLQFLKDTQNAPSLQSVQDKYGKSFWYYYMQRKMQEKS
ncbi:MAG: DUF6057 family protein [Bacteroidaceae bacterium]|nr:DUF6057 family protein [Bacteroidaceae bacterium]